MVNSMNTHQVLVIVIVDTRVLGCVADSLQERRFPSIGPTDYKDTKASIFRSEIIGRIQLARVEVRRCKGLDEFEHLSSASSVSVADSSTGRSSEEGPISIDRPVKAKSQRQSIIVPPLNMVILFPALDWLFFPNNNLNANTTHHLGLICWRS